MKNLGTAARPSSDSFEKGKAREPEQPKGNSQTKESPTMTKGISSSVGILTEQEWLNLGSALSSSQTVSNHQLSSSRRVGDQGRPSYRPTTEGGKVGSNSIGQ